ncbi:MAG: hypothetical protein E2P02_24110 [Acidobacteria bacterium]|nr:MAG: hypothetical protein E2P02_24110 [Acidobacteriota bacterium]
MAKILAIDPAVIRRLRELSRKDRAECLLALCELPEAFGRPHIHAGIGIRKLGKKLFECRADLSLRFIFLDRPDEFYVSFLGNHDEVKTLLKSGKYG